MFDRTGPFSRWLSLGWRAVTAGIGPLGAFACPLAGFAFFRRLQIDAGPAGLGKADRDGLFCRASAVFAVANVLDFLANELARLGAGRFAFSLVAAGSFDGFLFWHGLSLPFVAFPEVLRCDRISTQMPCQSVFCGAGKRLGPLMAQAINRYTESL